MGSTNFLHKKLVLQKKSNMIFITLFALANVCLAFDLTLEPEGKDRALCCVDAKHQCSDKCSGKLCSESCEARCGLFNTNCGSWSCQDIAGFSCTPTTTQAAVTAASCVGVGETCLSLAGDVSTCCSGDQKCTDSSSVLT